MKLLLVFILSLSCTLGADENFSHRILFLLQADKEKEGFELYREYARQKGGHDFILLHQIGELYLDKGINSGDLETQLMATFGSGIANSEHSFARLCKAVNSEHLAVQLIALKGLVHLDTREGDEILKRLMKKGHALIRLESTYQLALKKYPVAASQAEVFMSMVPDPLLAEFPAIFAAVGDTDSIRILKRLAKHPSEDVRASTILSAAKTKRDDFLPIIRSLSVQGGALQQEACAFALGVFNDSTCLPCLKQLAKSPHIFVKLAACSSLARHGDQEALNVIMTEAFKDNAFAAAILASFPEAKETLAKLAESGSPNVRLNAAWGLLEQKDPRALPVISAILMAREQDLALIVQSSPTSMIQALKIAHSAREVFQDSPADLERSDDMLQEALIKTVELNESDFHELAGDILRQHHSHLIPTVVELLVNHRSEASLNLLNKYRQTPGAPLLRNYCNLGLYKLKTEGPYAESLKAWVLSQKDVEFFNVKDFLEPSIKIDALNSYEINPKQSARLLIEILESFTRAKDEMGVDLIISMIENGHRKNRFALAGLLILATE